MKTLKLLLSILIISINCTFATHNSGAYISCQHITAFTYKIHVVTFTKADEQADRCELTIKYSTGDSCVASRINGITGNCPSPAKMGELIGNNIRKNIYECTYTFPGQNIYTISFADPNRTADLMNIPNSVNVPFYVETKLFAFDPLQYVPSSGIGFANTPINQAIVNEVYESDTPIDFSDGDSLTYHLTSCMVNGGPIAGYTIPPGVSINNQTGHITWAQPTQIGQWALAVMVKKWRQNILVGTSIVDFSLFVMAANDSLEEDTVITDCPIGTDSVYGCSIDPLDSVNIVITNADSNTTFYSEISSNYVFYTSNDTGYFRWKPTANDARHNPYKITFRKQKDFTLINLFKDITFFITVNDTSNQTSPLPPTLTNLNYQITGEHFTLFPNPSGNYIIIENNFEDIAKVKIIDALGQVVMQDNLNTQNSFLNIQNLKSGLYVVEVSANDKFYRKKILKE